MGGGGGRRSWEHGRAREERKPRFQKCCREETCDQQSITWHSAPWGFDLYLVSLEWVLGGMGKRLIQNLSLSGSPWPLPSAGYRFLEEQV